MAELPDEAIEKGSELLKVLARAIAELSATEWALFERYGENAGVESEIEKLSEFREDLSASARLCTLLVRICESQASADPTVLELLERAIEQAEATLAASQAGLRDLRRVWKLK